MSGRTARTAAPLLLGLALALTGCGADEPGTAAPMTDEQACATFGSDGVESRLVDAYDDQAASQQLVDEYAGAPLFQKALQDSLDLLRTSGGDLEGDFLAVACGG